MTDNAYQPAGYCPHCGYAIDPGVCPECGKAIVADELDRLPHQVTRRRMIKRTVAVLVILSLAAGGWYVYARCNWIAWVPTRALLGFQGDEDSRTSVELRRRLAAGWLSSDQVATYLENALTPRSKLIVRSPHPDDMPIKVVAYMNCIQLPSGTSVSPGDWVLEVDGRPTGGLGEGCIVNLGAAWIEYRLPPMPPGTHKLKMTIAVGDWSSGKAPSRLATITLQGRVTVDKSQLTDHVKLSWSGDLAERVRGSVAAVSCRYRTDTGAVESGVYLRLFAVPAPLAFKIKVRPHGRGQYRETRNPDVAMWSSPGAPGPCTHSIEIPAGTDRVDIRLVPDPKQVFYLGFNECVNAVIEWHGVPVLQAGTASQPTSTVSDGSEITEVTTRPTLVYEATATRPSE